MSEIIIDFGSSINKQDLTRLRNRLNTISPEDEIAIRMEAADAHQADWVTNELRRQGFDYQPHGGHGNDFYIKARRRTH